MQYRGKRRKHAIIAQHIRRGHVAHHLPELIDVPREMLAWKQRELLDPIRRSQDLREFGCAVPVQELATVLF
jgi:hypothetical protein